MDLNRFSADSLSRLGSRYQKAHEAVCQETSFLLHRLPGLEDLSFSDGTPFAAPETRSWLQSIAFRWGVADVATAAPLPACAEGPGEERAKVIEELRQMIRQGRLLEAMESGQRGMRDAESGRERILWRLDLGQMLFSVGKTKLALPYLEQALEDIDRHGLEEYDPELALRGLRLCRLSFSAQEDAGLRENAEHVLRRIGRLDMPEMVRLSKE